MAMKSYKDRLNTNLVLSTFIKNLISGRCLGSTSDQLAHGWHLFPLFRGLTHTFIPAEHWKTVLHSLQKLLATQDICFLIQWDHSEIL